MRVAIYNSLFYDLLNAEEHWGVSSFNVLVPCDDAIRGDYQITHYCQNPPAHLKAALGVLQAFEVEEPCPWCKKAVPDFYILQAKLGV